MPETSFAVELENEEETAAILDALKPPPTFLEPAFNRIGARLTSALRRYPPAPAGSTYRRTNTLGRRWTFSVKRSLFGIKLLVGNNTQHGPWVQSADQQARVHQGRWQTDAQVLEQNAEAVLDEVQEAVEEQINKARG
ncbi:MAG: hypothetical protein L0332_06880 [Chloroflexi bacterium]|nr:hypothetical protein [Chloroflexota bacterium]